MGVLEGDGDPVQRSEWIAPPDRLVRRSRRFPGLRLSAGGHGMQEWVESIQAAKLGVKNLDC
jgi:hypothetical protein